MESQTIFNLYKILDEQRSLLVKKRHEYELNSKIIDEKYNISLQEINEKYKNENDILSNLKESKIKERLVLLYDSYEYKSKKIEKQNLEKKLSTSINEFDKIKLIESIKGEYNQKNKKISENYFKGKEEVENLDLDVNEKSIRNNELQSIFNIETNKAEEEELQDIKLVENGMYENEIQNIINKIDKTILELSLKFSEDANNYAINDTLAISKIYYDNYLKEKEQLDFSINIEKNELTKAFNNLTIDLNKNILSTITNISNKIHNEEVVNHKLPLLKANDSIWSEMQAIKSQYSLPLSFILINDISNEEPLILDFFNKSHLIIKYNNADTKEAYDFIKLLFLKSLLSFEPGTLKIYLQKSNPVYGNLRNLNLSILDDTSIFIRNYKELYENRNYQLNPDNNIYNWDDLNKIQSKFSPYILLTYLELNKSNQEDGLLLNILENGVNLGVNCILGINTDDTNSNILEKKTNKHKVEIIDFSTIRNKVVSLEKYINFNSNNIVEFYNNYLINQKSVSINFKEHYKADTLFKKWEENKYKSGDNISLLIGVDDNQNKISFNIETTGGSVHNAIGGKTGSGKSVFTSSLLLSLIHEYSHEVLELHLLDFKQGITFLTFKDYPHVKNIILNPNEEFVLSYLKYINNLAKERNDDFADKYHCKDISQYNREHKDNQLKRIIIVVDEAQQIFNDKNEEEINETLSLCRSAGINFIITYNNDAVRSLPIKNINNEYSLYVDANKVIYCEIENRKFHPFDSRGQELTFSGKIEEKHLTLQSTPHKPFIYKGEKEIYLSEETSTEIKPEHILIGREYSFTKKLVEINLLNEVKQNILILGDHENKYAVAETILKSLSNNSPNNSIVVKIIDNSNRNHSTLSNKILHQLEIVEDDKEINNLINHIYNRVKSKVFSSQKIIIVIDCKLQSEFQDLLEDVFNECSLFNIHFILFSSNVSSSVVRNFAHQIYIDQNAVESLNVRVNLKKGENSALYFDNINQIYKKFKIYTNDTLFNTKALLPLVINETKEKLNNTNQSANDLSKTKSKSKQKYSPPTDLDNYCK
jgi:hypothetical protein